MGFCALPDGDCDSGYRFVDEAGGGLAGSCTPAGDAGSTGVTSGPTSTGSSTSAATLTTTVETSTSSSGSTDDSSASSESTEGDETTGSQLDCVDRDGDAYGVGVDCMGPDCDDGNADRVDGCLYIAPDGSDGGAGTRDDPWGTFSFALGQLASGDTLVLLDGVYGGASGLPLIECSGTGQARCQGGDVACGEAGEPIRMIAENEGRAYLDGDGSVDTLRVEGCRHWDLEGITGRSADAGDNFTDPVEISDSAFVNLRRLTFHDANDDGNNGVFEVDESESILLEECNAFDGTRRFFSVWLSSDVTLRRCYGNGASGVDAAPDLRGVTVTHSQDVTIENTIIENVDWAYDLRGGTSDGTKSCDYDGDGLRLYGSIARAAEQGIRVQPRQDTAEDGCVGPTLTYDVRVRHTALVDAPAYFQSAERIDSSNLTVVVSGASALEFENQTAGLSCAEYPSCDVDVHDSILVANGAFSGVVSGGTMLGVVDVVVSSSYVEGMPAYGPSVTSQNPDRGNADGLSACPITLPPTDPQRMAGNGAWIDARWSEGISQPDRRPLWDPATGAFPCGPQIDADALGLEGDLDSGCQSVHQRLGVVPGRGCAALPD